MVERTGFSCGVAMVRLSSCMVSHGTVSRNYLTKRRESEAGSAAVALGIRKAFA